MLSAFSPEHSYQDIKLFAISHQVFRIRDFTRVAHYKSHFSYVQSLSVMTKISNHRRAMMKKIIHSNYSPSITTLSVTGAQTSINYCLLPLQVDKNSLSSTLILNITRTEKFNLAFT